MCSLFPKAIFFFYVYYKKNYLVTEEWSQSRGKYPTFVKGSSYFSTAVVKRQTTKEHQQSILTKLKGTSLEKVLNEYANYTYARISLHKCVDQVSYASFAIYVYISIVSEQRRSWSDHPKEQVIQVRACHKHDKVLSRLSHTVWDFTTRNVLLTKEVCNKYKLYWNLT